MSPDELAAARWGVLRRSGWRRAIAWVFGALLVIQVIAATVRAVRGQAGWEIAALLWAALVLALGVWILPRFLLRARLRKHLPQGLPVQLSFSEEGIRDRGTDPPTQIAWDRVKRWGRQEQLLVLQMGRHDLWVAPTGALSHEQRDELLELVTEKLDSTS